MISEERNTTFVWRCLGCPAVYDGESLALLLDDGTRKACPCGGSLSEDVGTVPERGRREEPGQKIGPQSSPAGLWRGV